MRVAVSADHAGFHMKQAIAQYLDSLGHSVLDLGTNSTDPVDYPDFSAAVAHAVLEGRADRGIIICGSGVGASVAANKFVGIRAGLCHDCYSAHQGVEHDNMNILVLGSRVIGPALANDLAATFLQATFSGEARHLRRLAKIAAFESQLPR